MKNIILLNGSPKGVNASSNSILDDFKKIESYRSLSKDFNIEYEKFQINDLVKNKGKISLVKKKLLTSDAVIISFPLYVDCLPSIVIEFFYELKKLLESESVLKSDNTQKIKEINCKVYAIVNSGFPEGAQNKIACEIVENFCKRVNLKWGGAIGIGMGGMANGIKHVPMKSFVKKNYRNALESIYDCVNSGQTLKKNIYTKFNFPKKMYLAMGTRGWYKWANENGVSKKSLYARPYKI